MDSGSASEVGPRLTPISPLALPALPALPISAVPAVPARVLVVDGPGRVYNPPLRPVREAGRTGRVAQLARALPSHGRGHRFKSCCAHSSKRRRSKG